MSTQTTGTDPGSKSSAEIEREVQESRAEIEHTLDAIQERLSPGQLVDQALGYFRGGRGVDFARNLGDSIAQNPIPVTLMGVGLAWMMFSGQRSARDSDRGGSAYWDDEDLEPIEERYGGFADEDMSYLGAEAESGGGFAEDVKGAGRAAKEKLSGLGEQARGLGEQARGLGEHARDVGAQARERVGRAGAGVAERAHEARERARYHGRRAKQSMLRSLDEQPLVLGAIGLAIGAALGAALPPTETEDELMGEARDKALRQATRAGREGAEKVREAAGAVAAAAREEVSKQGSTLKGSGDEAGKGTSHQSAGRAKEPEPGQSKPAGLASDTPFAADPKASLDRT
jgi:hypothetical protein